MPIFKATYTPKGTNIRSSDPDPTGSTHYRFSAKTYVDAVRKAGVNLPEDFSFRRVERVDGGRNTIIYDREMHWGQREDQEDSSFGVVVTPPGVLVL